MEGPRLPPSALHHDDDDKPDDPPTVVCHRPTSSLPTNLPSVRSFDIQSSSSGNLRKYSLNFSPNLLPPPPPPPDLMSEVETYVVQLPRDQIYWVPPPEHARIIEQHRINPVKKDKPVCSKRLAWFFVALILLGILAGSLTLIFHFVYNPALPAFTVEKFLLKSSSSPRKTTFEITLKAHNPTSKLGIKYVQKKNDGVSLTYKDKKLGHGKFPEMSQGAGGSDPVHLKLDRSKNAELPASKKQPVKMELKMDMKAEFVAGPVKKIKNVAVTCDMKVKGLETNKTIQIISNDCKSEFVK